MSRAHAALLLASCLACGPRADLPDPTDAGFVDGAVPGRDAGPGPDAGWTRSGTVTLTLGTWNIEQFPKTATTTRAVSELLDLLDADILGIQEIVDAHALIALDEARPDWAVRRVREPYDFLAVGLLYRPDRVRVLDAQPIFTNDPYAFPRPPLWAKVEALDDAGRVVFDFELVVVHLKALGDDRSEARRRRACVQLEAWIRGRIAEGGDEDIVVLGDYNDKVDDVPEDNVFLPFLDAPDRYLFLTEALAEAGASSYILRPGLIDHILVTRAALDDYGPGQTRVVDAEALYPGYVRFVSDHRPVLATFVLR